MAGNVPRPVTRQEWQAVQPPAFGAWMPHRTVTVVLPAKDCQDELDLTLAALAEQSYPADLMDVVVVDDDSAKPLQIPPLAPARSRVLRLEAGEGHGSGRARHAGAEAADGEILLFLDADMVATRTHVEAHARWHHVMADAVVIGRKQFVDFDDITAEDVRQATAGDAFDGLLDGRPRQRHSWLEDFIRTSHQLTDFADDTFVAVVGASVSTPRALYVESGGFSSMGLRGIVDTEFGYRIFTAGGVVMADPEAHSFHQGARNFKLRGDEIKRERSGLAANFLPVPLFRPANTGRSWTVPVVRAVVDVGPGDAERTLVTIDSVLGSSFTDLSVVVSPRDGGTLPRWLLDYFAADSRVEFGPAHVATGFPSPYTLVVPAGVVLATTSLARLREVSAENEVGVVRVTVPDQPATAVEFWATRALHRARRHQSGDDLEDVARRLFGEIWQSGEAIGLKPAEVGVTRQGMLVDRQSYDGITQVSE